MRYVAVAAVLLVASCARPGGVASNKASTTPMPGASAIASNSSVASPSASPASSPSPSPSASPSLPPAPSVSCVQSVIPTSQAVISGSNGTFIYDVTDPLHPRAVCRIANTYVHILTGTSFEYLVPQPDGTTEVVLHALGSNNESVASRLMANLIAPPTSWVGPVAWTPDLGTLAYMAGGGTDANGFSATDVWVATPSGRTRIFTYGVPGKDAFGRPGFAPVTLAFSSDGAYLAAGWSVATKPVHVFRVSDKADVSPTLPADFRFAFWSKTGATLYIVGDASVSQWTPGSPVTVLSTPPWTLGPNFSPDGTKVAFTVVTSTHQVRTYVYDLAARANRLLVDQPRSSAVFVKAGWLWQMEEKPCVSSNNSPCFDPTVPDGNVLVFDLANGREGPVVFASGESPSTYGLTAGDLWPSS
jgi:WD40 repeat protein